jgi:glycosyltransferase involved in cell wall biosynthesis
MKKVSILIPVYNAENYLVETLNSIFHQTYTNLEIIAVNDGSTDRSLALLERYKDKITIIDQPNKGQCAALNLAITRAKGELIKFFDADDLMNPEHIELQVAKLEGQQNAIASCEWGRFYNDKYSSATFVSEPVWKDMNTLDWLKTSLKQNSDMMGGPLWLVPKEILAKAGTWNEELSLNNDFDFSIRLLLSCEKVLFTEGARLYYRSGNINKLSGTSSLRAFEAAFKSTQLGCNHLLAHENSSEIRIICANRFQIWAYQTYPLYPKLTKQIEKEITKLGGSNIKIEGGKVLLLLTYFLGWKMARRVQHFFYRFGYTPTPPYKSKNTLIIC